MGWPEHYRSGKVTLEEAVSHVRSGNRVVITLGEEPRLLASGLQARAGEIENVVIQCAGPANELGWFDPGIGSSFKRPGPRTPTDTPIAPSSTTAAPSTCPPFSPSCSRVSRSVASKTSAPTCSLPVVSPPDQNGFCSFGHSLWNKRSFAASARMVIVEVDPRTIRTFGTNSIHVTDIDYFVENPDTGPRALPLNPGS